MLVMICPGAACTGRLAILQRQGVQLGGAAKASHRARQKRGLQPLLRQHAHARLGLVADAVEHAAYQGRGIERGPVGGRLSLRQKSSRALGARLLAGPRGRLARAAFAHEEAPVAPGLHQALGQQLVIGTDHGGGANLLLLRALAHRGQTGPRRQQPVPDALGKALGQLFGERLGAAFHQHDFFLTDLCQPRQQYSLKNVQHNCTATVLNLPVQCGHET
jgi:hypothetical protein